MALGKTHDRIGLVVGAIASAWLTANNYLSSPLLISAIAGYTAGIIWLSPDLDTVSKPYHRWGLLKYYWLPYQKMMKHRGWSHAPILGNLGRIAYLFAPPILIALYCGAELPLEYWREAIAFTLGCEVASLVHLKLDGII